MAFLLERDRALMRKVTLGPSLKLNKNLIGEKKCIYAMEEVQRSQGAGEGDVLSDGPAFEVQAGGAENDKLGRLL